jgi:uncharacterized iron-regulated membrane protein
MSSSAPGIGARTLRVLHWLHLWSGIVLCVPLVLLGITGSVLVFDHEIEDLIGEGAPKASASGEARNLDAIVAAAVAAVPTGVTPSLVMMPEEPGRASVVRFAAARQAQRPGGSGAPAVGPMGLGGPTVFVDPVSLDILGQRDGRSAGIIRQIHLLHANLLIRDRTGREIVGWLGVIMLGFGITGLVLWWPKPGQWRFAFGVRRKARGARFHRELHGAVGFWGLLVFIAVSFSGVYLVFPQTLGEAVKAVAPARDLRATPRVEPTPSAAPLGFEEAASLARAAVPDAEVRLVALPNRSDQPARVSLAREGHEHGAPMVTAFIDPGTRRVAEVRDPRDFSAGETFMAWQRGLHAGQGLGWTWRILVFLSGFLPLLFSITGVSMWWLKRRARQAAAMRKALALGTAE